MPSLEGREPASYEWEGEKLSWEGAGGLAPEKLPEYVDYVDPGDELEEEEC